MNPSLQRILVIGGNGFVGSAVCKAALAKGMQVVSVSSSGRPYQSAKGHVPAWASKVEWNTGDALRPETFAHLLPQVTGVVHTLGTLMENRQYKKALKEGNMPGIFGAFLQESGICGKNPLEKVDEEGSYEVMNRDSALRVCEAFVSTPPADNLKTDTPRPFVFISAEDVFRPFISARYIETKREAEQRIEEMMRGKADYRGVFIRPSLIYHAHQRPLTSPIAVLVDLSSALHSKIPSAVPTPSSILRSLGSAFPARNSSLTSPLDSVANALTIPPIHVEHVAEAVCVALDKPEIHGVVGVQRMRELIGWKDKGEDTGESRLGLTRH